MQGQAGGASLTDGVKDSTSLYGPPAPSGRCTDSSDGARRSDAPTARCHDPPARCHDPLPAVTTCFHYKLCAVTTSLSMLSLSIVTTFRHVITLWHCLLLSVMAYQLLSYPSDSIPLRDITKYIHLKTKRHTSSDNIGNWCDSNSAILTPDWK